MEIFGLIPTFGNLLYTVGAFIVALSIIVAVHEYGHYIVGRWSGIYAEVFSLGFGPVLFSRRDRHGTRWQIAALPFGGYVKFLGDSNAASGKDTAIFEDLDEDTLRHTMHGAPLWARAATVAAGPVFNFILSIIVFAGVSFFQGQAIEPPTIAKLSPLPVQGSQLAEGDEIVALNGQPAGDFASLLTVAGELPHVPLVDYTVRRDGEELTVKGAYPLPPIVSAVQPRSAAMAAGLEVGDVIVAVDGAPVAAFRELQQIVSGSDGKELTLSVWRNGTELEFTMAPRRVDLPLPEGGYETRWLIGMSGGLFFEPETSTPGLIQSLGRGVDQTVFVITSSLSGLYHIVTGAISSCNISGPIGIAETTGAVASQGAENFIWFIAVLSAAIGLMNLFPIPVLDGGHLVFHAYEALVGKPPSERSLQVLMSVGLAVILSFMLFAIGNDLFCR